MTDMTPEELQAYRDAQYASTAPASWIWSEEEMAWLPPIPAPQDNQPYFWNEENKKYIGTLKENGAIVGISGRKYKGGKSESDKRHYFNNREKR